MNHYIKILWSLLNTRQKKSLIFLQISVITISIFELITIGVVASFMGGVSKPIELLDKIKSFNIGFLNNFSDKTIFITVSLFVIAVLTISSLLSVIMTRYIYKASFGLGNELTVQLFKYYQTRDWIYYITKNSSELTNSILIETTRLMQNIITPLINSISRFVFIFLISISILIYDFWLSSAVISFFILSYYIISKVIKYGLSRNSIIVLESNKKRSKICREAFDNIRNVILLQKQDYFIKSFSTENENLTQAQASNLTLTTAPRYMMEWLAYVSMTLIIVMTVVINGSDFSSILPLLTIYGLAAFKLLPALQQAYASITTVKGNLSALDSLKKDLLKAKDIQDIQVSTNDDIIEFTENLSLHNGVFTYPNKSKAALNNININIKKHQKIGVVGPSGSGKSTLIDVLCGLLNLDEGVIKSDNNNISDRLLLWRKNISYVPQVISLSDSSIAENIAFGVEYKNIDWDRINTVIDLCSLSSVIEQLEDGVHTCVGEKGVQLSGGQRQRISIARALYNDADILILDEATSALDGVTENEIMNSINKLSGKKTIIIIAHRLKTIKDCDVIYFVENGNVIDSGSYIDLLKNNEKFKKMEMHA
ncbi:TPA: ABC transporter ATP-binding protein [Photobacterium damselae]